MNRVVVERRLDPGEWSLSFVPDIPARNGRISAQSSAVVQGRFLPWGPGFVNGPNWIHFSWVYLLVKTLNALSCSLRLFAQELNSGVGCHQPISILQVRIFL